MSTIPHPGTPEVLDLTPTTRVRLDPNRDPFAGLAPRERMQLIVQVLCELVAYGELEERRAAN